MVMLYILVSDGNLTKNQAGGPDAATLDGIFNGANGNAAVDAKITFGSGMTVDFTQASKKVDIKGATVSAEDMDTALTGQAYTVANGAQSFDVAAGGAVTATTGGATVNIGADGELTTATNKTVTETYHEFANGNILDDDGAALYKAADGSLTTEATGKSEVTTDPLKALDDAIASVDKFRSSLGAVQNRLDSAVTNLNNTTTNLSEAQSRIQDADYATEVSNMSKAQIIQQAGNSVLAKANQVPQQVLSLLQG